MIFLLSPGLPRKFYIESIMKRIRQRKDMEIL